MIGRYSVTAEREGGPIPPDILSDLMRYSNRRWHILNLLARCSGAFDLGHSNPALLYALASNWVFHKPVVTQPIRAARSLMNVNQKQILTWLGFPGTETVRHIMRKIVPASLTVEALLYLRESLHDPDVTKCLSHLDRINAGVLRLVTDQKYRVYLSPRLLNDIGIDHNQDEPHPPFLALFKDTLMMADMVDRKNCPRRFTSLARLYGVHDELSRYVMPVVMAKACALPTRLPVPPFAGTDSIRPILTPTELFSEGLEMKHCAAIRAMGVAEGQEYLYRVFSPVRATLGICRHKAGWQPGQLFKECNVTVDPDVRNALFAELFRSGHSDESLYSGSRMRPHAFVGEIYE